MRLEERDTAKRRSRYLGEEDKHEMNDDGLLNKLSEEGEGEREGVVSPLLHSYSRPSNESLMIHSKYDSILPISVCLD